MQSKLAAAGAEGLRAQAGDDLSELVSLTWLSRLLLSRLLPPLLLLCVELACQLDMSTPCRLGLVHSARYAARLIAENERDRATSQCLSEAKVTSLLGARPGECVAAGEEVGGGGEQASGGREEVGLICSYLIVLTLVVQGSGEYGSSRR
eukprot:751072-Hanusia_phi.AAC.1